MSKAQEIISSLRKLYPDLEIILWIKDGRGRLLVNERTIFRFDPDFIEKQLNKFGKDGIIETTKIWAEYIETRYIKRVNRFNKNPNGRPGLCFTKSQILFAMNNTKSNSAAARFLNTTYNTYAKYAKLHGLFEQHKNEAGIGIAKGGHKKKVPLEEIFENKHPNYNLHMLKNRLISEMIFEEKCEICGYHEKRAFDDKIGLVLDFKDGNSKNRVKNNMRLICFNCRFNVKGKLSENVLRVLDREYNQNIIKKNDDKVEEIWTELNENEENSTSIVQTNIDNVEDMWNQYNKQ